MTGLNVNSSRHQCPGSAGRARVVVAVELVVGENNSLSDAAYGCGGGGDVGLGRL